jgi:hypothetical protein
MKSAYQIIVDMIQHELIIPTDIVEVQLEDYLDCVTKWDTSTSLNESLKSFCEGQCLEYKLITGESPVILFKRAS